VGKVAILACGFQGGVNALGRMCKAYGVTLTEGQMQNVVTRWRETNQAVVQFWGNLDRAAVMAVTRRKSVQQVGLIAFYCVEDRLLVRLPSGRMLTYWHPDLVENQYGEYVVEVDNVSLLPPAAGGPWPRKQMYGGLWAENVTQATAADVLREALVRCEDDGLLTVGHTHDEIITETTNVERDSKLLERALTDPFEWSGRLPLGCDIQTGARYRK
jgi:DNA polymerase